MSECFSLLSLRCANTQPVLCKELGLLQVISSFFWGGGNLLGPFQVIPVNFRQFEVISGNLGNCRTQNPKKKQFK